MRITAEYLCDTCVTFRPTSEDEAAAILRAVFDLGPCWSTGVPEVRNLRALVRDGMTVVDGQIFVGIDPRDTAVAVMAQASDLGIAACVAQPHIKAAARAPQVMR